MSAPKNTNRGLERVPAAEVVAPGSAAPNTGLEPPHIPAAELVDRGRKFKRVFVAVGVLLLVWALLNLSQRVEMMRIKSQRAAIKASAYADIRAGLRAATRPPVLAPDAPYVAVLKDARSKLAHCWRLQKEYAVAAWRFSPRRAVGLGNYFTTGDPTGPDYDRHRFLDSEEIYRAHILVAEAVADVQDPAMRNDPEFRAAEERNFARVAGQLMSLVGEAR